MARAIVKQSVRDNRGTSWQSQDETVIGASAGWVVGMAGFAMVGPSNHMGTGSSDDGLFVAPESILHLRGAIAGGLRLRNNYYARVAPDGGGVELTGDGLIITYMDSPNLDHLPPAAKPDQFAGFVADLHDRMSLALQYQLNSRRFHAELRSQFPQDMLTWERRIAGWMTIPGRAAERCSDLFSPTSSVKGMRIRSRIDPPRRLM